MFSHDARHTPEAANGLQHKGTPNNGLQIIFSKALAATQGLYMNVVPST
jgi:hypothetical protein